MLTSDIKVGETYGNLKVTSSFRKKSLSKNWNQLHFNYECSCGLKKSAASCYVFYKIKNEKTLCVRCERRKRLKISKDSSTFNVVLASYRCGATKRGLEIELSNDELRVLFKGNCHYCGSAPSNSCIRRGSDTFIYNGIDRVKNNIGYTKENSVSCCHVCNWLKNKHSKEEFLSFIEKVYKHNFGVKND